jgi:hypothetical protein
MYEAGGGRGRRARGGEGRSRRKSPVPQQKRITKQIDYTQNLDYSVILPSHQTIPRKKHNEQYINL